MKCVVISIKTDNNFALQDVLKGVFYNSRFHFSNTDKSMELCRCNKFLCYEGKDEYSVFDIATDVMQ